MTQKIQAGDTVKVTPHAYYEGMIRKDIATEFTGYVTGISTVENDIIATVSRDGQPYKFENVEVEFCEIVA